MTLLLSLAPLVILIFLMVSKKGLPAHYTLPLVATLMYLIQLLYFKQAVTIIHATVIVGLLTTATPMLILWGAILMFNTMDTIGSTAIIRRWLDKLCKNEIARLMLIGWAFSFFLEGISGFGTPAVLAAPLLVASGFPPLQIVAFCLIMNTIPVSFGAVGTPIWFGLGEIGLTTEQLQDIGFKTAFVQGVIALVIPVLALRIIVSWNDIRKNILFILISILSTVVPYVLVSALTVEFPSIIGGLTGLITTAYCAHKGVGLASLSSKCESAHLSETLTLPNYFKAFFPLSACVLLLLITRIPYFGLRDWLNTGTPWLEHVFSGAGQLKISSSAVIYLNNIFETELSWKHPLLYIPSLLPFGFVSVICFLFFKVSNKNILRTLSDTSKRLQYPFFALLGAMLFVKLFMFGGNEAPTAHLGTAISNVAGGAWRFMAVYLGALGSFFAGSCTISNLTFAPIQATIAERLGVNLNLILSLQTIGGSMGNMACIHNIVAVCAMLGLKNQEGPILRKTLPFVLLYGILAVVISMLFQI